MSRVGKNAAAPLPLAGSRPAALRPRRPGLAEQSLGTLLFSLPALFHWLTFAKYGRRELERDSIWLLLATYVTLFLLVGLLRGLAGVRRLTFLAVGVQLVWLLTAWLLIALHRSEGTGFLQMPYGEGLAVTSRWGVGLAVLAGWHVLLVSGIFGERSDQRPSLAPPLALVGLVLLLVFDAAGLAWLRLAFIAPDATAPGRLTGELLRALLLATGTLAVLACGLTALARRAGTSPDDN